MAHELLSGPHAITFEGSNARFASAGVGWHDAIGLVGNIYGGSPATTRGVVVQLDGTGYARNDLGIPNGWVTANLRTGGLALRDIRHGRFYEELDRRILRPTGAYITDGANVWTVLPDRYIRAYNGKIYTLTGTASVLETTFSTASGEALGTGWISAAERETVFVAFPDGTIFQYDYAAKTAISFKRKIGSATRGVFYSKLHRVFVSIHQDATTPFAQQVKVWAREIAATVLEDPVALDTPTAGYVSRWRVRLLGADSDPVAGALVDWSTVGPGTLTATQSKTDADGYATTSLAIPVGAVGNVQVDAEVVL